MNLPAKILPNAAIFLLLPLCAAAISAANFYVAPQGTDSNDGRTEQAPLKSIQKALDMAEPGDAVNLAPGDYFQDIVTRRHGRPDAPISLVGQTESVVRGGGKVRIIQVNHDHHHLVGFTVNGLHGNPEDASGYRSKLVFASGKEPLKGVTGLRLLNMKFYNSGTEAVRLKYFSQFNQIAYCTIINSGVYFSKFGLEANGEGIYLGTTTSQLDRNLTPDPDQTSYNWIHNNYINTQCDECVDIKEGSAGNIVENNVLTGQKKAKEGVINIRGNLNVVRYNEIYGGAGAGVRFGTGNEDEAVLNDVYLNHIYSNAEGGIKFQSTPQGLVCGNVMHDNTGGNATGSFGGEYDPAGACIPELAPEPEPEVNIDVSVLLICSDSVELGWTTSAPDGGRAEAGIYRVLRNSQEVGLTLSSIFHDTGLNRNTAYEYQIELWNSEGQLVGASDTLRVQTLKGTKKGR
jgi:hypothetical protein